MSKSSSRVLTLIYILLLLKLYNAQTFLFIACVRAARGSVGFGSPIVHEHLSLN